MNIISTASVLALATATAQATVLMSDDFTYTNGGLVTVSGGNWFIGAQVQSGEVQSGTLFLDKLSVNAGPGNVPPAGQRNSYRNFPSGNPSTGTVYASFKLTVPVGNGPTSTSNSATAGPWFAAFATGTTPAGRLFLNNDTVNTGNYKIGVSRGSGTGAVAQFLPDSLIPGKEYQIVHAFDLDNDIAKIWINPTAETSTSLSNTTGTTSPATLGTYTFHNQATSTGSMFVDDLIVSTSFSDVVPTFWNNASGATWNLSGNWTQGIPDAAGASLTFGSNPPGLSTSNSVTLDGSRTAGHVVFSNSTSSYTVAQGTGGTLNIDNTGGTGIPSIGVTAGTHTISAPVALANGVTVTTASSTSLTVSGALSGNGVVTKSGSGTLNLTGALSYTGATTVDGGKLSTVNAIQNGAAVTITGAVLEIAPSGSSTSVTSISSLTTGAGGKLELHDNDLVLNYGVNPSTYNDIVNKVKSGLVLLGGAGTTGITSAEVDAQTINSTVLAVVDDGDPNIAGGITSLSGYTIPFPTSSVLVKFTWFGDANLDGVVNGSDYALTDTGFTSNGALGGWVYGDYDYSGVIDGADYALIDTGFIAQSGTLPEPTALGLFGLAALGMYRRRRN